jgi:hypothetical protein
MVCVCNIYKKGGGPDGRNKDSMVNLPSFLTEFPQQLSHFLPSFYPSHVRRKQNSPKDEYKQKMCEPKGGRCGNKRRVDKQTTKTGLLAEEP